jgi:hypothetical protein
MPRSTGIGPNCDTATGIDVRLENRRGERLAEVSDPKGVVNWLLSLVDLEATACLRFIDPYGETLFNTAQLPVLRDELASVRELLTPTKLQVSRQQYLQRACAWPTAAREEAAIEAQALSIDHLESHLSKPQRLVADAIASGPHHYCRFVGD